MHSNHIISAGYEYFEHIKPLKNASHTEHVITFLETGQLRFKQGQEMTITPGTVTLVPAGVPHGAISGGNAGLWWLGFCSSCLSLDEKNSLMLPFKQVRLGALPLFQIPTDRHQYLINLFKEITTESASPCTDTLEITKSLLLLVLNEIKKSADNKYSFNPRASATTKALEYIQQHSLEPISLKDVANAVHLNPTYLATLIKKNTGFSVGEWIARSRLSAACFRLLHTDENIETVDYQVGWNDVTHFIRMFKKTYHCTPALWRKSNRQATNVN